MKSNTIKELIIVLVIFSLGFLSGFLVNHFFFQPSKTPPAVNEERKRIQALPDSAFTDEFNKMFGSKGHSR